MANLITKTKLNEGPKRAIFHFYFEGDGSGELQNEVLIDPVVDFELPLVTIPNQLTITKLWYGSAIYDSILKFNALNPLPIWVIVADADSYVSFEYFGGLKDFSTPDGDGKILISTNGLATAGTAGTLIIEVKKD